MKMSAMASGLQVNQQTTGTGSGTVVADTSDASAFNDVLSGVADNHGGTASGQSGLAADAKDGALVSDRSSDPGVTLGTVLSGLAGRSVDAKDGALVSDRSSDSIARLGTVLAGIAGRSVAVKGAATAGLSSSETQSAAPVTDLPVSVDSLLTSSMPSALPPASAPAAQNPNGALAALLQSAALVKGSGNKADASTQDVSETAVDARSTTRTKPGALNVPDAPSSPSAVSVTAIYPSADLIGALGSVSGLLARVDGRTDRQDETATNGATSVTATALPGQTEIQKLLSVQASNALESTDVPTTTLSSVKFESFLAPKTQNASIGVAALDATTTSETKPAAGDPSALPLMSGPIQAIAAAVDNLAAAAPAAPVVSVPTAETTQLAPARTMTLQLTPANLGTVEVRLHLTGQSLDVGLSVSDPRTLGLLDRERDSLSAALGGQSYQLHSLVIQGADATASMSGDHHAVQDNQSSGARSGQEGRSTGGNSGGDQPDARPRDRSPRGSSNSNATRDAGSNQLYV